MNVEKIKKASKKAFDVISKNKFLDASTKIALSQIPILGNVLVELYNDAKNKETATTSIITLLEQFQAGTDEKLEWICTVIKEEKESWLELINSNNQKSLELFSIVMNALDIIETKGELGFLKMNKELIKLKDMIQANDSQLLEKIEELKNEHIQASNDEQAFDTIPNQEFLKQTEEIKTKTVSEFETPENNRDAISLENLSNTTYVPQRYIHLRTKKEGEDVIEYSKELIKKYSNQLKRGKELTDRISTLQNKIEEIKRSDKFLKRRRDIDEKNLSQIERKFERELSIDNKKNIQNIRNARKTIITYQDKIKKLKKEHIIPIVGDYGSGKTFFAHKIAYELSKVSSDFSIFCVPLGELQKHNDLNDHLKEDVFNYVKQEHALKISFEAFTKEITKGKIIFVLDALDELSTKLDKEISQTHLKHVVELSKECVVVLTGRHTYFTKDMEQLFDHDELIKLLDFNEKEIQTFLHKALPNNQLKIKDIREVIDEKRIDTLATKPLFLFVICKHFEELNKYSIINEAVILRTLTEEWIRHDVIKKNIDSEKKSQIIEERQRISEVLAFRCYSEGKPISLNSIREEVDRELEYNATKSISQYYKDAVNSTFLVKESEDRFRFIVKPIAEYLVG